MFLKLFSFFNKTQKKNPESFSVSYLQKRINAFKNHSSYNKKDLKHFESLYGLILLKKQEALVNEALEAFLTNLKDKYSYSFFISKLLLSTFKTKNVYLISQATSIVSKYNIHFYKEDKAFQINAHKMFFIAINSCRGNNAQLTKILLNSSCFSWFTKTFSFKNLLEPTIYQSIKNKDHKLYFSIMDSLGMKANYSNGKVIKNASIIALENNYLEFFDNEYSFDIYSKKEYSRSHNSADFLLQCFFCFINQHKFEAATNVLKLKKELNNSYFQFLSDEKYSNNNDKVISAIRILMEHDNTLLKLFIHNIKEEMNNNYISEDILNVFNYRYLELLNNSNIDFFDKIDLLYKSYLPKNDILIKFFKNFYTSDNKFLNHVYDLLHSRTKRDIANCIEVIKTKEKINSF
tara:strand:- start:1446 stop:2660 length:1215 start_codon:yes stop_codon:yes gene_type:complete